MIRAAKHPKDPAYYPWPLKQADKAAPFTEKEQLGVFLTAAGISITIALIDITYRAIKRAAEQKRLERENAFSEDPIQFVPTTLPLEDEPDAASSVQAGPAPSTAPTGDAASSSETTAAVSSSDASGSDAARSSQSSQAVPPGIAPSGSAAR